VHMQNLDTWDAYAAAISRGVLPLSRAYRPTAEERMIRELVLQLKLGKVQPSYFARKYGVNLLERFKDQLTQLTADGFVASADEDAITLTRPGLLRVDTLLPRFFLPEHAAIRYT